jgi:hypothetical protein
MHLLPERTAASLRGPGEVNRFDRSSGEPRREATRYRIEGGTQVVAEEKSPGGAEAEAVYRETWRYRAERTLVAGLLAFDDIVLVATDKPSLVCLDRRDGTPRMEEELPALPEGPLFYLSGLGSLAVFGANGTLSIYALEREASASADPVEALLQPAPEAFALIEVRMRERLAKRDEQSEFLFHAYRPRTEVPSSGIVLYRFDPPASGKYRIYIDGAGKRPCLVELFSYSGEPLASNLDYVGLEPVLEHGLDIGAPYFIAAAFLGEPVPEALREPIPLRAPSPGSWWLLSDPVHLRFGRAGRGPLAGPVVAAAAVLPEDFPVDLLDDSKKLTEKRRERAMVAVYEGALAWGIGWASPRRSTASTSSRRAS